MRDTVVIKNLQERGFDFTNVEQMLIYESVERTPRFLDREPKRLSIKKVKDLPVFGCKQEFIIMYQQIMSETSGDVFTVDLNKVKRYCDKEVYVVLQALIRSSISYNQSIAENCYELFRVIVMQDVETLTIARVYEQLASIKSTDYWSGQLLSAIRFCLFGESPVALYWGNIAQFTGLYKECFERGRELIVSICKNEKEVDAFVRTNYKEARADKEFMKNTYTDGISKPMIAMLYVLSKDNPEVLKLEGGDGW